MTRPCYNNKWTVEIGSELFHNNIFAAHFLWSWVLHKLNSICGYRLPWKFIHFFHHQMQSLYLLGSYRTFFFAHSQHDILLLSRQWWLMTLDGGFCFVLFFILTALNHSYFCSILNGLDTRVGSWLIFFFQIIIQSSKITI